MKTPLILIAFLVVGCGGIDQGELFAAHDTQAVVTASGTEIWSPCDPNQPSAYECPAVVVGCAANAPLVPCCVGPVGDPASLDGETCQAR